MKCPNEISNITELREWIIKVSNGECLKLEGDENAEPHFIELDTESPLRNIKEFGNKEWNYFMGIPIKYE